jgi:hypothetical protein
VHCSPPAHPREQRADLVGGGGTAAYRRISPDRSRAPLRSRAEPAEPIASVVACESPADRMGGRGARARTRRRCLRGL